LLGCDTPLDDQAIELCDGPIGVDATLALHAERLAGELIDDVQELQGAPVGGLIELEVKRPDVIGALC
jgi:hypothetical protein